MEAFLIPLRWNPSLNLISILTCGCKKPKGEKQKMHKINPFIQPCPTCTHLQQVSANRHRHAVQLYLALLVQRQSSDIDQLLDQPAIIQTFACYFPVTPWLHHHSVGAFHVLCQDSIVRGASLVHLRPPFFRFYCMHFSCGSVTIHYFQSAIPILLLSLCKVNIPSSPTVPCSAGPEAIG